MSIKKLCLFILVTLFGFPGNGFAQKKDMPMQKVFEGLRAYETIWTPEKLYAHTNKVQYEPGEVIWIKTYVLNGVTHKKSENSKVVYIELINNKGSVVSKKKTMVNNYGSAISLDIPSNIKKGVYKLRCYTKYLLNDLKPFHFEKDIAIGKYYVVAESNKIEPANSIGSETEVTLEFYPESGKLLYDTSNTMAVKSVNSLGEPLAVDGDIVDENQTVVTSFQTDAYGVAKLSFTPRKGSGYSARIEQNSEVKTYDLPQVEEVGYLLHVENMGHDIVIKAVATGPINLDGTTLVGHLRGEQFLWFKGTKAHESKYIIKIPAQMGEGIAHFTLFNAQGEPVSERLVLVQNQMNNVNLSFKNKKDDTGGKMQFLFDLKDQKGIPVKGNLSVSVVKNMTHRFEQNIRDWLHFHSDICNDELYAKLLKEKNFFKRKNHLDALMIASKWERFSWEDIVPKRPIEEYIAPEKGIMISGTTKSMANDGNAVSAMVSLDILGLDIYQTNKRSDFDGKFRFGPFDFTDSISVVLKATKLAGKNKTKSRKLAIVLDKQEEFILPITTNQYKERLSDDPAENPSAAVTKQITEYPNWEEDFEIDKDITRLKEVVVTEKKKTKEELITEQIKEMTLYNRPSFRVFTDSLPSNGIRNVIEMFRTLPGVQVKGGVGEETVRIRYGVNSILLSTEPLFLVDGVQVPLAAIKTLSSLDIMFIDVLKGAAASVYGTRGSNGAIAVYTRRGAGLNYSGGNSNPPNSKTPNILAYTQQGFDRAKTFTSKTCNELSSQADNNLTVLWEPELDILGAKHKELSFCTEGSGKGEYVVRVEGVSEDGKVISEEFRFTM